MILGVMSDTHGNRKMMHEAADVMTGLLQVEHILHAGDDYADAEELGYAGVNVTKVPGLWCPEYTQSTVPNRVIEEFDGLSIAMTHADKDLRALEMASAVVITGHTHVAVIEILGMSVYLNPGHLKSDFDRGQVPSFATISTGSADIRFAIHEINGDVRTERTASRDKLA
jgi:hypothetical protein